MSTATTDEAIIAAAGRVAEPPRPLPFALAKRHGVLVRVLSEASADVVVRGDASPLAVAEVRRHLRRPLVVERVDPERFEVLLRQVYEGGSNAAMDAMGGLEEDTDLGSLAQEIPEPSDLLESEDERRSPDQRAADAGGVGERLRHPHRAVRKPAGDPLPGGRGAARGAADQARRGAADRFAHQGHVAPDPVQCAVRGISPGRPPE